jgi:hypothetical protein
MSAHLLRIIIIDVKGIASIISGNHGMGIVASDLDQIGEILKHEKTAWMVKTGRIIMPFHIAGF